MSSIRIVLVEDHTLVRAGIRALLQGLTDVEVVAEAGDGQQALALIEQHRPDIVLMDVNMPHMNGLEASARIVQCYTDVHVILLSVHSNEEYVLQALQQGVKGYLLKHAETNELETAIKVVMRGDSYLSPLVSRHVSDYIRRVGQSNSAERLTPRQREILQLIASGCSTQQMAAKLSLSVKTVETHRAQLMERLDIHDIAGLVRFAIRIGLVMPSE